MAISNTTYQTAIVIPSVPFNLALSANDAGVTKSLWYKYTAIVGDNVLGVFGFGGLGTYEPRTSFYISINDIPEYLPEYESTGYGRNRPIQVPVTPGETYFIEFSHQGASISPADLIIDIIRHVEQDYPNGSLMIPDDTWGLPGAILSPTTGEVLKFIQLFPAGERGDSLTPSEGGQILAENYADNTVKLFSGQLNLLKSIPFTDLGPLVQFDRLAAIVAHHTNAPKFYVAFTGTGQTPARFTTVSKDGIPGPITWTLLGAGLTSLAINIAGTVALITGNGLGLIKRWDLINNVGLSNFPDPGGMHAVYTLKNDNIIVTTLEEGGVLNTVNVKEYSSNYTLLHNYLFTDVESSRVIVAEDDPNSIWIWFEEHAIVRSRFVRLRLSDGVHLQEFTRSQYESTQYEGVETATPPDRFGHSFSCPIFLLYKSGIIEPPDPTPIGGIYKVVLGKTSDTLYIPPVTPGDPPTTVDVKIPDPYATTFLIGNE